MTYAHFLWLHYIYTNNNMLLINTQDGVDCLHVGVISVSSNGVTGPVTLC